MKPNKEFFPVFPSSSVGRGKPDHFSPSGAFRMSPLGTPASQEAVPTALCPTVSSHLCQKHQGCQVIVTVGVLKGPDEEAEDRAIVPTVLDDQRPEITIGCPE